VAAGLLILLIPGIIRPGAQAAKLGDYYAACIQENLPDRVDCLFGPAYKGIPLAVAAASSLFRNYGRDLPYCFNRKEVKDHGEGGLLVGYQPKDGDQVVITEDVVTAGTAVRETIALFQRVARVDLRALVVSVDRMERGTGERTTLNELREDYGIAVYPIVTVREVIFFLHNRPIDGTIYIDDAMKVRMEAYLQTYGGKIRCRGRRKPIFTADIGLV
jgi:orotate phosphoribosyltransferase